MHIDAKMTKTFRIRLPHGPDHFIAEVERYRGSVSTQKAQIDRLDASPEYPGKGWVYVWGVNVLKNGQVGQRRVNGTVPIGALPMEIQNAIEQSGVFS